MDIMQFLQQNWYAVLAISVLIVGTIAFNIMKRRNAKASNDRFLSEHPDAAKVYLVAKALVTSEAVVIHTVNGQAPERFFEGTKGGFYLVPGQSSVLVSYTYTRPGVMYKTVTKSTGPVTKELVVEAHKSYLLSFDRKAENFTFEELSE